MQQHYRSRWVHLVAVVALTISSLSCTWSLIDLNQNANPATATPVASPDQGATAPAPVALAETTFSVSIPTPLKPGESLVIGLLDEVTGLGLNPVLYPMSPIDSQRYTAKLPLTLNSVVKYRYYRQGSIPSLENTALGFPVRYRIYSVTGPGIVDDKVASWSDGVYQGKMGRIIGAVLDAGTGRPVPNILVTAGGVSTLTDSLGQYVLEGLPEGTHLLAAFAIDGAFSTFQQGAVVADGQTTSAPISLKSEPTVQVTFIASVPADTVAGAPVRLAGNLLQLGNTFSDLGSGISTVSTRMPTLKVMPDGRHSISIRLPAGADIRYKYTLGDGFWNAEHASDDSFVLRQLIVPANDVVVQDTVTTWQAGKKSAPILFDVTVPGNTPTGESVSIQFNPFGWTEPLPMWPLGNNRWVYKLYGPLNMLGSFHYRYCRNDQCGSADDAETAGNTSQGRTVNTSVLGENIQENISSWAWWPDSDPGTLVAVPVAARKGAFWAGVELSPNYSPNWQALFPAAMQNVQALGSSYVIVTPRWTAALSRPLIFAPTPGSDPFWADTFQAVQYGRAQNLNVAIYATPQLLPSKENFWMKAPRTPNWWNDWFDRYRAFALYHADLASQSGAQALILGGDSILPSLPGGILADGTPSNVPADAEARWRAILTEVHQRFTGPVLWAYPYKGSPMLPAPVFIDQFYALYILWSAPLASSTGGSLDAMTSDAVAKLDNDIAPFLLNAKKGAVIAIDYPSVQGAASGCVSTGGAGCLDWMALSRPYPDLPSASLDLKIQADLYQAMLQAINTRDWVGGFISRGYYTPLPLMDKSSSTRGKMAADLLWYWFPRLMGVSK
jgi:hypothetical protein